MGFSILCSRTAWMRLRPAHTMSMLPPSNRADTAVLRNGPETTSRFHTDWGTAR